MSRRYLLLSGGVGGARLCDGFYRELRPEQLAVLVNTGDDFEHCGLHISPDVDTLLYTLAGLADEARGWGLQNETWTTLNRLGELGGERWFQLGDQDLATHLRRTALLRDGQPLQFTVDALSAALHIGAGVFAMCNEPVRTFLQTSEGRLAFQEYFVRRRCEPTVQSIEFCGAEAAAVTPQVESLLRAGDLHTIVICPSNPFLSVAPIFAVPGMLDALRATGLPVVAVSPIVGGRAIKGPAAAMLEQLGYPVSALGVAQHYAQSAPGFIDTFVIDTQDQQLMPELEALGMRCAIADIVMRDIPGRRRLARWLMAREA